MTRTALLFPLAGLLTLAQLAGCRGEPTTPTRPDQMLSVGDLASKSPAATVERDVATLRAATTRFHRFDAARKASYTYLFMNTCMTDGSAPSRGAMGYHYVNTGLLDGTVDVATPEALLYEPGAQGELALVGVEYVIPQAAWAGPGKPKLFGREFTLNGFGLWALHVWAWRDNPSGIFADWNPRVSCEHASAGASAMAAH
ncbi:hypothetical protein J421_5847 (plasmid) [Gemmatirosa kalamazoonensis]|uniref:Lipoprotein n=1 Tax=Gemmatirosa kalamazoonensis TaxID=861299 RepID=W0RSD8_9BACT|nr:hypothetical protein [Gemmatirosa kalamazoonensis]AHG93382.1 hypothetical protein J421_5847 [Gemmatirosa kalamazoonensis]